ncbi:hypothetical protein U1Q18_011771 [Sarracenia purpurea var. burkii]
MFGFLKCLTVTSRLKNTLCLFHSLCTADAATSSSSSWGAKFKSPSHQTIHLFLEKCSTMVEIKQLHAQIVLQGLTKETLTLGKLVSFCAVAEAGDIRYAHLVFDQLTEPNRFMYNSLIRGYSNSDDPSKAIFLYRRLIGSCISPNEFTLPFVLKACARKLDYLNGVFVHGQAIKLGIGSQVCIQNALINVYVVCGLGTAISSVEIDGHVHEFMVDDYRGHVLDCVSAVEGQQSLRLWLGSLLIHPLYGLGSCSGALSVLI